MNKILKSTAAMFALVTCLACNAMDEQDDSIHDSIDLNTLYHLAREKGEHEAQRLMECSVNSTELLNPISTQLEATIVQLKAFPEVHSQFKSFVYGFVWVLKKHNLKFPAEQYNAQIATCEGINEDAITQKSRKELVELLTADLTKANMLTLDL